MPAPLRVCSLLLALALGGLGFSGCVSSAGNLVTVRSLVDAQYDARGADDATRPPETFVLSPGRIRAGKSYHSELATNQFAALAETLGLDLVRAGYRPAADARAADLLIVVHWGITDPVERDAELMAYDPDNLRTAHEAVEEARLKAIADAATANAAQSREAVAAAEAALRAEVTHAAGLYSGNELQTASNAELLGYREVLQANENALTPTAAGETLQSLVNEERYFVVLIAYDAAAARAGQRRPVWTTRMSITATGQNFRTALDRMSYVAATSHGRPQAGILIAPSAERPAAAAGDSRKSPRAP